MKQSNLSEQIPTDWRLIPLKAVCHFAVSNVDKHSHEGEIPVRLCNYTDVYKNESVSPELELLAATATVDEIQKFHLKTGDVVITKDSESWDDIGVPAYVKGSANDFVCGYHLALLRPQVELLSGRFLFRCLQSRQVALQLELSATGVTRYGIPKGAIGNTYLPLPPLATQNLIANYLDRETARIDALIAEKQKMLSLLEDKQKALISQAVTRGIEPSVPVKPSGLEWVGDIPRHWGIERLKRIIRSVNSGVSVNASDQNVDNLGYGVLKTSAVAGGEFKPSENKAVWDTEYDRVACPVTKNTIVMSRMNTPSLVGESGYISENYPNLFLPDRLWQISFDENRVFVPFISLTLATKEVRQILSSLATGTSASMKNLAVEEMSGLQIPIPPLEEQVAIHREVETQNRVSKLLINEIINSLQLIKERRSALISAAVTGQIPLEYMCLEDKGDEVV